MEVSHEKMMNGIVALGLTVSMLTAPVKKAEAGVIVAAAASTVALPVALGVAGLFAGFGTSVFSIYWAIDHREKSWYAYGLFMLDEHLNSEDAKNILLERYPTLENYVVDELAAMIEQKSHTVDFNQNGYKELVFSKAEVNSIIEIIALTDKDLANQVSHDLTTKSF
jgi:hypothetical protein